METLNAKFTRDKVDCKIDASGDVLVPLFMGGLFIETCGARLQICDSEVCINSDCEEDIISLVSGHVYCIRIEERIYCSDEVAGCSDCCVNEIGEESILLITDSSVTEILDEGIDGKPEKSSTGNAPVGDSLNTESSIGTEIMDERVADGSISRLKDMPTVNR